MNQLPSKRRLQVIISDEAWDIVETTTADANRDFEVGSINYSDVINEMILTGKVDLKSLQTKRTDIKRSLRFFAAQDNLDIDSVIKTLTELKSKTVKKTVKPTPAIKEVRNE